MRSTSQQTSGIDHSPTAVIVRALLAVAWAVLSTPAFAQSVESDTPPVVRLYAFEMHGRPLAKGLETLIRETDISLVYETALVDGRTVNCRIARGDIEQLLGCVLAGTGLDYYRLSGGTFILTESAEGAPITGTVSGRLVDSESGIPVRDAHVAIPSEGIAVSTDEGGRFNIPDLPAGPYELLSTHVAYDSQRDSVLVDGSNAAGLTVLMHRRILRSGPVIVVEGAPPLVQLTFDRRRVEGIGPASIPYGDLSVMPTLESGAGALLRDGYGELHVQGGSAGHVEYRIDGVPIFNPVPNGGVITPFSPAAIGHGVVYGAGFGANVGSQLSGIVDLGHAVPRTGGTHVLARVDPVTMNGRLTRSGRIGTDGNLALMFGLRIAQFNRFKPRALLERFAEWSTPDIFLADVLGTGTGAADAVRGSAVDFDVIDAHGAAVLDLGGGRELSLSGYFGRNEFGSRFFESDLPGLTADEYVWRNLAGSVRFDWVLSGRNRLRTSVWTGTYVLNQPFSGSPVGAPTSPDGLTDSSGGSTAFNEVSRFGLRTEIQRSGSARVIRTLGLEVVRNDAEFAVRTRPALAAPDLTPAAVGAGPWRITGYANRIWNATERGSLESGIRVTSLPVRETVYAEPRVAWQQEFHPSDGTRLAYRLSGGLFREFMTQLDIAPYTESALLPGFRVWIPSARNVSPSRAWHLALDATLLQESGVQYAVRAWHKYSPHVVGIDYARTTDSDDPLGSSRLRSTGSRASVALERSRGRIEIGAALESSELSSPGRFGGRWLPAPWNAPRSIDLSADIRPTGGWNVSARFAATAGRAWSWRPSYYAYLEPLGPGGVPAGLDLSTPENDRLPVHARLDVGVSRTGSLPGGRYSVGLTVLNVTDRRNVVDRMLAPASADSGGEFRQIDRLATPRLFLASLTISF